MSSFICKCGTRLRLGEIPNPIEWLAISDNGYDQFTDLVDAEELYEKFTHMLKCPTCSRLWVYWEGFSQVPICYAPESE